MISSEHLAIRLMIAQSVLFAAETAIIHQIGARTPVMLLALIRGGAGVALAVAIARPRGFQTFRTRQISLQLGRGAVSLLYLWVMIYSFGRLPFADATAISYAQPAYIAVFSVLILGETVAPARWLAAVTGIAGAILVAKPTFGGWNAVYLVALAGTGLNGLSFVLNRYLQRQDSATTTMLYANLVPLLGSAPFLVLTGPPAPDTIFWLAGLVLCGPLGVYVGIVAARQAKAATLAPFTLLRLVIALLAGAVIFCEPPTICSLLGSMLILASCMIPRGGRRQLPHRARLARISHRAEAEG